ncbi:TetR/AcrR family transcriptional regulator [Glycocaulis sp.]
MTGGEKRGRPRDEAARRRVLKAAYALLEEGGVTALTMEAVAARAKVGKPTLYRSWPNAQALAMAALIEAAPDAPEHDGSGPALAALRRQVRFVVEVFASRIGRSAAALVASATRDTEIFRSFRSQVILSSRTAGRALIEQAIREGDVRSGIDIEAALDAIYGPVFFRVLVGHEGLDEGFADRLMDTVLEGLGPR